MGSERRIYARYDIVAQVEIEADDETIMLPLQNLSLGGALLGLPSSQRVQVDLGDEVDAFLDFGSDLHGESLAVSLEAEIVRFEEHDGQVTGLAIRWVGGSDFSQRKLGEIVARLSLEDSQAAAPI
jgi:c-di-GMP-binding flagellar brake protein YcgR